MRVLVLDVGGSNLKFRVSGWDGRKKVPTGPEYTPEDMMEDLGEEVGDEEFDAVTVGFPSPIVGGRIKNEPKNLGGGWKDFCFEDAFGKPVKLINDAAMQAVGCYEGGRMLFLSLGTGLGSALIADYHIMPLELCELRWSKSKTLEGRVGKEEIAVLGRDVWEEDVWTAVAMLQKAFVPDSVVIGGGAAKLLRELPDGVLRGHNNRALDGGEMLWNDERFRV